MSPDRPSPGRSAIVPSARALILCVERDPHIRELESYFLDRAGFVVQFVEDGPQALELARSLKPSIVITEIHMVRRDLLRAGAPFLQKPFSLEDLDRGVRGLLDRVRPAPPSP